MFRKESLLFFVFGCVCVRVRVSGESWMGASVVYYRIQLHIL